MYTVHQAKTNLSQLIREAENGGNVVIARGKKPVARLVAVGSRTGRKPGELKGRIHGSPRAFAPMSKKELKDWGFE